MKKLKVLMLVLYTEQAVSIAPVISNPFAKFLVTLLELGELFIFVSVSFRALASSGV